MVYASSKDALKKKLVGISNEVQATDHSDLNVKDITAKILTKMVKWSRLLVMIEAAHNSDDADRIFILRARNSNACVYLIPDLPVV